KSQDSATSWPRTLRFQNSAQRRFRLPFKQLRDLHRRLTSSLKPGMTERQVAEVSSNRVPDRVVMKTCGTETPKPFACKVYVYEGALRAGRYDPKLSVVLEDVRGQWIVTQWL